MPQYAPAQRIDTEPSSTASTPTTAASLLRHLLLIGPDAAPLAKLAQRAGNFRCTHVDSFVEAILTVAPDALPEPYDLIIAGIVGDQANLHAAIATFRKVHPAGKLVLLCHPHQEPQCRRALASGANDYLILPIAADEFWAVTKDGPALAGGASTHGHAGSAEAPGVAGSPAAVPATAQIAHESAPPKASPAVELLYLPIMVQTALMSDVLQSTTDLPARALATLQSYFQWPGTLRIVAQTPPAESPEYAARAPRCNRMMPTLDIWCWKMPRPANYCTINCPRPRYG